MILVNESHCSKKKKTYICCLKVDLLQLFFLRSFIWLKIIVMIIYITTFIQTLNN